MKTVLVFLVGVAVGGFTVRLLTPAPRPAEAPGVAAPEPSIDPISRFRADEALEPPVDGEDGVPDERVGEPGGTTDQRGTVNRASGLPDDLDSLSAELLRLLDSDDEPRWKTRSVLEALARLDDPRGLERVLDCMREDCAGRGAAFYAELLAGVRDPRVLDAANETLEANLAVGDDSWIHTHGYLDMIADQGGPTAAGILLGHLGAGGQLGHGAARAVALLDDPALAQAFLERIRTDDIHIAWQLARALASWGDAGTIAELFDIGFGGTLEAERRSSVLHGTAEGLPIDFAAQFVARVEALSDADARMAGLSSLGYLGSDVLGSVARPVILAALASSNQAIAATVLSTVREHEVLHTAEVEVLLAAWLPNITDPDLHREVTRTLARVRNR